MTSVYYGKESLVIKCEVSSDILMKILGISLSQTEASACLSINDKLIISHSEKATTKSSLPIASINLVLQNANLIINDIDQIIVSGRPFLSFYNEILLYLDSFPFSLKKFILEIPKWLDERLVLPIKIEEKLGFKKKIIFIPYHLSLAKYVSKLIENSAIFIFQNDQEDSVLSLYTSIEGELDLDFQFNYFDFLNSQNFEKELDIWFHKTKNLELPLVIIGNIEDLRYFKKNNIIWKKQFLNDFSLLSCEGAVYYFLDKLLVNKMDNYEENISFSK